MKILHCCLSCFYIDNYNYQENVLPRLNKADGHEVLILASTETFINNSDLGYVSPSSYETEFGVPIVRIPYYKVLNHYFSTKIRKYIGVNNLIENFNPDIIMFHGCCAYELLTVSKYIKKHPWVKLYVDCHEDFHNSAQGFFSKYILHKLLYKNILKSSLPSIEKVLYLTYESKLFLNQLYKLPDNNLEFYPLGGIIINEKERIEKRSRIRTLLNIDENDILLVHSGKMDKIKHTEDIVRALSMIKGQNIKLIIIGTMTDDVKKNVFPYIENDNRIEYIGWKNSNELIEYLCACDLYVQPGGQSATMQNALCCGSAVVLYPHESHKFLLGEAVFYCRTVDDIKNIFELVLDNRDILNEKLTNSNKIAHELLDYKNLAKRLYS